MAQQRTINCDGNLRAQLEIKHTNILTSSMNYRMVAQIDKWLNTVTILLVQLLSITSHLLSSIAICDDITLFAIYFLDSHSETDCMH